MDEKPKPAETPQAKSRSTILIRHLSSSMLARSLGSTGKFLRSQIWVWPLIAIPALVGGGYWVWSKQTAAIRAGVEGSLNSVLNSTVNAMQLWERSEISKAQELAGEDEVVKQVTSLVRRNNPPLT